MEKFSVNMARAFVGKNVNLHLKDGAVIVNVHLAEIQKDEFGRETFVRCVPYRRVNALKVSLRNIAWADLLDLNLLTTTDGETPCVYPS